MAKIETLEIKRQIFNKWGHENGFISIGVKKKRGEDVLSLKVKDSSANYIKKIIKFAEENKVKISVSKGIEPSAQQGSTI